MVRWNVRIMTTWALHHQWHHGKSTKSYHLELEGEVITNNAGCLGVQLLFKHIWLYIAHTSSGKKHENLKWNRSSNPWLCRRILPNSDLVHVFFIVRIIVIIFFVKETHFHADINMGEETGSRVCVPRKFTLWLPFPKEFSIFGNVSLAILSWGVSLVSRRREMTHLHSSITTKFFICYSFSSTRT